MSESQLIFHDFRDEQEDSKYPFSDRSTLQSIDRTVELPKKMFVDASVYTIGGRGAAYISQIAVTAAEAIITVKTTGSTAATCTGTIAAAQTASSASDASTVTLSDRFNRPAGVLVLRNAIFGQLFSRPRTHNFNPAALELAATCFMPTTEKGLRGVLINDTDLITGNILIVGYNGIVVRKTVTDATQYASDKNYLRFDVIGNPLFERFKLEKEGAAPKTIKHVRTINGSPPDEFGNFVITPLEDNFTEAVDPTNPIAIRVYPTNENSVVVEAVGKRDV